MSTTAGIQISGNRRLPAINETISTNEARVWLMLFKTHFMWINFYLKLKLTTTTIDSSNPPATINATSAVPSSATGSSTSSSNRNNRTTNSSGGVRAPRNDDAPHIGKYRLIKTIGKGNFAKVKLAKHELIGKEVCYYLLGN